MRSLELSIFSIATFELWKKEKEVLQCNNVSITKHAQKDTLKFYMHNN